MISSIKKFAALEYAKERDYWIEKLCGEWEKVYFPHDFNLDKKSVKILDFEISGALFSKITAVTNRSDHRLLMILTAGFTTLLWKYTGQKDIVIGIPIDKQDVEGEFINTVLALRTVFKDISTFKDLLMNIRQTIVDAHKHQNYPIDVIAHDLNRTAQDRGGFTLFDNIVLLKNIHDKKYIHHINVNIIFSFFRIQDRIEGTVEYNRQIYAGESVERIVKHFIFLLNELLFNPDIPLLDISLLSEEEKRLVLFRFNNTNAEPPEERTIHALFEKQVSCSPSGCAVDDGERSITYKALNDRADCFAYHLKSRDIQEGSIVALMGHRSIDMIAAILGILKAGAAYLPINAQDPADRIVYILADSKAKLLITEQYVIESKKEILSGFSNRNILLLEKPKKFKVVGEKIKFREGKADSCAYIIYTSGTTGFPKGVVVRHKEVVNYVNWAAETYVRNEKVDFPFYTSFSFDMSITSIFTPLITGNTIVIYGGGEKEFLLAEVIDENRVGIVKATPSHLRILCDERMVPNGGIEPLVSSKVKRIVVGGENLEVRLARDIVTLFGDDIEIFNEYGPTETTVGCMIYKFDIQNDRRHSVPIGVPIDNTQIYLLDDNLKPVPPGVDGELYISGSGVTGGYLNKVELTEDRFIANPFAPGQKMYRTGDIARWLPDWNIEYISRNDGQVKIRGFRIEIGEIEARLHEFPGIKQAVVITKKHGKNDILLAAYYSSGDRIDSVEIKQFLLNKLPDYMVPVYYMKLDNIPLTASGKIDRKSLPEFRHEFEKEEYISPRNDFDRQLVAIWSELFGVKAESIAITMNFFDLGGHSLSAAVLISNLHKAFNIKVPLAEIFKKPTIKELSDYLAQAEENLFSSVRALEKKEFYPASSVQNRLYFLQQLEGGTAYNISAVVLFEGDLKKEKLEHIISRLIERHESFRTSFMMWEETGIVAQKIRDNVKFKIDYDEVEAHEAEKLTCEYIRPFDLSNAPMLRVRLVKIDRYRFVMVVDMHHIISDGGSLPIFFQELMDLYAGRELPALKLCCRDYSGWQNIANIRELVDKQKLYWTKEFKEEVQALQLPLDFNRPALQDFTGSVVNFELCESMSEKLKKIALEDNISIFMLFSAIFHVLLAKLSGQDDIVVGTPTAGRMHADLKTIIGMFVNTLALRSSPKSDKRFVDFLIEHKRVVLDAVENQDYHFEELVDSIILNRDLSRNPLFDVMFTMDNIEINRIAIPGLKLSRYEFDQRVSKFDLSLLGQDKGDKYHLTFEYATKLFKRETIEAFVKHFKQLISTVIANRCQEISEMEIVSTDEKEQILFDFNDTKSSFPERKTIHGIFEEQAARMPDHKAVIFADKQLTYLELEKRSCHLAGYLRGKGAGPVQAIAIMVKRSLEMITGIMGILKSGGAYLPIDPDYPEKRVTYMLRDSRSPFLLVQQPVNKIFCDDCEIIDLTVVNTNDAAGSREIGGSRDSAYVIYTSGSTGLPKGVIVEHHSLVNRLNWMQEHYVLQPGDTILQKTPFTFDVSVWEMFWWILAGAKMSFLRPGGEKDPEQILAAISRDKIAVIHFVPSMLNALLEYLKGKSGIVKMPSLRHVIASGEALNIEQVKTFKDIFYKQIYTKLANLYGPTEATIDVSFYDCNPGKVITRVPIGKPIHNIRLYVVDNNMHILPIGVVGELMIAGIGLARGYLNRPELTGEKFVPNPLVEGELMYHTGDLARWLTDGNLEFIGRVDTQVKIRGNRIELEEIETQLLMYDEINQAVVLDMEDKNGLKYLCAYIVAGVEISQVDLRDYLLKKLPSYMIPSYFLIMDKIPLNTSGKIDRKALREIKVETAADEPEYMAPGNPIEKELLRIWQDVLGREKLGIKENFFGIGGDSIKSIQVISRMNKAGYRIEMKDIFQHPTIARLALRVKVNNRRSDQSPVTGLIPLTPIQSWFFENNGEYSHHFNQAVMLHFHSDIDTDVIGTIFQKLQEHHDALRMTFKKENQGIRQENHGVAYPLSLEECDCRLYKEVEDAKAVLESKANEIHAGIDLENGPLMKLGLFHLNDGDRLLIVIHHLVIDGISWRILLEDFEELYRQYKHGGEMVLPDKTDSYKFWSERLREYAGSKIFLKEEEYWRRLEDEEIPPIKKDYDTGESLIRDTGTLSVCLNTEETGQLLTGINKSYNTEVNDILLTGLGLALKNTFGTDRVLLAVEGHGREGIIEDIDISRTVGWFTGLFPVILDIRFENDIGYQIKTIKEILHRVPGKGVGYGILRYLTGIEHKRDLRFKIKPQVRFNYLGQFDTGKKGRLFEMAKESPGRTRDENAQSLFDLDVTGMVMENRLHISLTYNIKQFSAATIITLLNQYEKNLREIIQHCLVLEERVSTPSDFTYKQLSIEMIDNLSKNYKIDDIYPLTSMQEGMLFHTLYEKNSSPYFNQVSYLLQGDLNLDTVKKSLSELFKRFDILRALYIYKGLARPLQLILEERQIEIHYESIHHLLSEEQEKFIDSYRAEDRERSFDPGKDVLLRLAVIRRSDTTFNLIWSWHHIILDGWSIGILNKEFFDIYAGLEKTGFCTSKQVSPYREYFEWLERREKEESGKYWGNYLAGYEEAAGVPGVLINGTDEYKQEKISFELDDHVSERIRLSAKQNDVTLGSVTWTLWGILLSKYTNKKDVVFGIVVAGRPAHFDDMDKLVGLFINTIPVRIRYSGETRYNGLLKNVQEGALNSEPHHFYPLAELQKVSGLGRQLFDHIIAFENYPIAEQIGRMNEGEKTGGGRTGFHISEVDVYEQTNYNLNLIVNPGNRIKVEIYFNANVYESAFIKRIGIHFNEICRRVIADEKVYIDEITPISAEEKEQILFEFNNTNAVYPGEKTILSIFEEQAGKISDNTAVISGSGQITYKELNKRANQLAGILIKQGVKSETIVCLSVERSLEMMVAIFAILKAGGVYLPLDANYPEARIRYILEDSHSHVLLTDRQVGFAGESGYQVIDVKLESVYRGDGGNLEKISTGENSAYIIYTSGSTGKPKGVLIEHGPLMNRLNWMQKKYRLCEEDTLLQKTTFTFDVSIWEIFWWVFAGARLCMLVPGGENNPSLIVDTIEKNKVTVIHFVPSMLNAFLEYMRTKGEKDSLSSLRQVIVSGEPLLLSQLHAFRALFYRKNGTGLANLYGPTEATIDVTYFDCLSGENPGKVPIGKPIDNIELYIVNENLYLQPVGTVGELCIAGRGLARGYINNNVLNMEKFVPNPFVPGERMYKTGDLARWLADGNIEFLGRMDNQVKVRGFRIELNEIESKLLENEKIRKAVALAKPREDRAGEKDLCAYLVSEENFTSQQLREYLSGKLPDYMIPAYFVKVAAIPLTPNGKVDRKALETSGLRIGTGKTYSKPQNDIEKLIAEKWQEVLHVDKVSLDDNFFDIGGTSIDMMILSGKLHEIFEIEDILMKMFRYPTVSSFARYISKEENNLGQKDSTVKLRSPDMGKIEHTRKQQKNRRRLSK